MIDDTGVMSDKNHVEAAVLAAYDQYAPSVSEVIADRCALAFREGFLAGHAEAETELRAENERLRQILKWAKIYFEDSQRTDWTEAQRAQAVIGVHQQFAKV